MKTELLCALTLVAIALSSSAEEKAHRREMTFTADRIAVDNVTKAAVASGHVYAVSTPYSLRSVCLQRLADGRMLFSDPTCATTCTNEVGHTHWNVTAEIEYQAEDHVLLRNAWLRFYEIPVFWLPYLNYPLDTDCGFSWMAGYTERWGAYVMTKYQYHIAGDPNRGGDTHWLRGATHFDLRYRNGIGLGEDLEWNLGDFGHGKFKVYYAWDEDYDRYNVGWNPYIHTWNTSEIERDRYGFEFEHRWEVTERDTLRVKGQVQSDSMFLSTFMRQSFFTLKNQWLGYDGNGVFWEHVENSLAWGAEASGPLNRFYGGVGRLPEIYFDVHPLPVFGLPINYETENRLGYLTRQDRRTAMRDLESPYTFVPGQWAEYDTFRVDTYHRLSAPFRTLDDLMSVVPRVGYHGTFWNDSGHNDLSGWNEAHNAASLFRSIGEGGVTFAGRGTASVNETWQHLIEPYLDVLAQKAWYAGGDDFNRPYYFDSIDSSYGWEDQFAGRSRNLPYSYYGVTPGLRNAWRALDDRGMSRQIVDFDVYAAAQFNQAEYWHSAYVDGDDFHKLAYLGSPNYGKNGAVVVPGGRIRWTPDDDIALLSRVEYDSDNNRIPFASLSWNQKVTKKFTYFVKYNLREYRVWNFSSTPYRCDARYYMPDHEYNAVHMSNVYVGLTQDICSWLAWSPYVRWDCRQGELDEVGSWIDYLTDCLGFRLQVAYENEYELYGARGYKWGDEWRIGFFIYLRAFGPGMGEFFNN